MTLAISERLGAIAAYCPTGARVADIGSDHALLAAYLLESGAASFVVAGEVNEGPFRAACRQLSPMVDKGRASVRKGDGLAVLNPGEVDVVCIAGMGGQLIVSILERGHAILADVQRLILQPNVGEELVRRWLLQNGWQLRSETILKEDQVLYEILVAEPGDPYKPYEEQERSVEELLRLGPILWRQKPTLLIEKWRREQEKSRKILRQVACSQRPETVERAREIKQELNWIDEVIRCLQTGKP
ncbi:tRNA (adenine(22)-N(1))-methyltransferase TrmK [Brevibacillus humidisoli]|uniref:tRNA (adenine(22)-N(1))-methyltransferase n=1 Tax=Brevibacillus humidisoli TaxID=2895522 RepID=UPI001E2EAF1B|nr:tRNA (adenine(22)-N(1))-methyltransferase TrmK [Brevibacillus humidisoli]UFJ43125.1 tRNA (adenine(22)-N(1))-methyltransferase TrmK [Brevibacillus humidisoli]